MAEMEGFEPPHTLRRLPDFESGPFNHLGTSPYNIEIISNCVLHGSLKGTCQLPPLFQGNGPSPLDKCVLLCHIFSRDARASFLLAEEISIFCRIRGGGMA